MAPPTTELRSAVHWGVAHGLPTLYLRRAAAQGDLQARLIRLGATGTDGVFGLVEEIRSQGPLYRSRIGYVTTSHAAVRHVLTSDDFRTGLPTAQGALGRISRWAAPTTLHPVEPPSLLVTEPPDHTRYRKLVTRVFTMRAVERLRERTEEIASDLLDSLEKRASGPVDLVDDLLLGPARHRHRRDPRGARGGAGAGPRLRRGGRAEPRPGARVPALPVRHAGRSRSSTPGSAGTSRRSAAPPATTCSASSSPSARRAAGWTRPS